MIKVKPASAFDIDGAVIDSVWENYLNIKRTWNELYGVDYPLDFETFCSFRPNIAKIKNYFEETKKRVEGLDDLDPVGATKTFYEIREQRKREDKIGWISEHKIYDGVEDMFSQLYDMGFVISIVSSKDAKSISELMEHFGILKYVNAGIIDLSVGDGNRSIQYKIFLDENELKTEDSVVYDDLVKNLITADELGMIPILAPQGYEEESKKSTFTNAFPKEFVPVVKEILKIDTE